MRQNRQKEYAAALAAAGIDTKANFYSLNSSNIRKVDEIRRRFKFSGRNSLGRTPEYQFYLCAQKANK